jgi:hypothetical protein
MHDGKNHVFCPLSKKIQTVRPLAFAPVTVWPPKLRKALGKSRNSEGFNMLLPEQVMFFLPVLKNRFINPFLRRCFSPAISFFSAFQNFE